MKDLLKIQLPIRVTTAYVFKRDAVIYITIPDNPDIRRFQVGKEADNVVTCIEKLFWQNVSCVTSQSNNSLTTELRIDINCMEFSGSFHQQLVKENSDYYQWSSELSKEIAQVCEHIRHELAEMLQNLAETYYMGAETKVGEHYAFGLRY